MNLYEAECEVNGRRIVYKTVMATDPVEAMEKVEKRLMREDVRNTDIEPPNVLQLICMKEDV